MLSVIVPAYNEELLIGRTLRALRAAGGALGQPFEVIVVDDASTDRTAAIAAEHGARVLSVHNRQIAATRNAGARAEEKAMQGDRASMNQDKRDISKEERALNHDRTDIQNDRQQLVKDRTAH